MTRVEGSCDGCLRPIIDTPFYKCNTQECKFVLHELCTRLPPILQGQAGHKLYLYQDPIHANAFCRVCNHFCKGFFYRCLNCPDDDYYTVDISCALIGTITHKAHPDHLPSRVETRLHKDYCHMCLAGFKSKKETSFSCGVCNFHLHRECAFSFPKTIRHRYDKHPMTLTYSPVENHEGDYFCEVCEEELNPNACFYHCHKCGQSIHSACARLESLPKSIILYGLIGETGGSEEYTHQN
ncbi:uncharacterized protein LOC143609008 [Bidens hawaiensis]|uniref:uncharacterized protein LOC143609008 n=1 Tax=Bidens hawaiensis TaxID=980011 RepID=UPI00404A605E